MKRLAALAAAVGGRATVVAPGHSIRLNRYSGLLAFTLLMGGFALGLLRIVRVEERVLDAPHGLDLDVDAAPGGVALTGQALHDHREQHRHARHHKHHRRRHHKHGQEERQGNGSPAAAAVVPAAPDAPFRHARRDAARRRWAALTAKHGSKVALVWRIAVGCDFSGFFTEVLGLLPAIEADVEGEFYFDVGACGPDMLAALPPVERLALQRLQARSSGILPRLAAAGTPYVLIQHKLPTSELALPTGNVLAHVARAMTESAVLNPWEAQQLSGVDEVWVPTQWHVGVFAKGGIPQRKLFVLPEAIDLEFFTPATGRHERHHAPRAPHAPRGGGDAAAARGAHGDGGDGRRDGAFRFLAVAKWEHRKGFDVLLRAFWEEFMSDPPGTTVLVLRTYKPSWEPGPDDLTEQFAAFAEQFAHRPLATLPRVVWVRKSLTREELKNLYEKADAFVLPTRGEGWGLPIVEAMSMGLPTISTNFSGPTAYLTEQTGFPVRYRLAADGTAEPDVDDLRRQMRRVHDDPARAAQVGEVGQRFIKEHYSAEAVAATAVSRLAALAMARGASAVEAGAGGAALSL